MELSKLSINIIWFFRGQDIKLSLLPGKVLNHRLLRVMQTTSLLQHDPNVKICELKRLPQRRISRERREMKRATDRENERYGNSSLVTQGNEKKLVALARISSTFNWTNKLGFLL